MPLSSELIPRIAVLELSAMLTAGVLGADYEKAKVDRKGTPVHDLSGPVLFQRLSIARGKVSSGHVDVAVDEAFGEPLLGTSMGQPWDADVLVEQGTAAARKVERKLKFDDVRFVAYSFPKIALQFLLEEREVLMLELHTWMPVPPRNANQRSDVPPGNFERFSLLDSLTDAERKSRTAAFRKRVRAWQSGKTGGLKVSSVISAAALASVNFKIRLINQRELHDSPLDTDHSPCYELRGQQTNVWCVAASTQMLLDFYRYTYDQVRIATELNLGTLAAPTGLPYANDGDVVTVIEHLSSNSLDATMVSTPAFSLYVGEINANRPMISFIPGHSRSVAGYTQSLWSIAGGFTGLLVYDPWPPTTGVITRWENFNTQTYRRAFTAVLKQV
jgi:hypothetical protein